MLRTLSSLVLCIALFFPFLLVSCAPQRLAPGPEDQAAAQKLWQSYLDQKPDSAPFRLSLSLRIGKKGDSRRVTALLWGNNTQVLRLDVLAGVGATLAKVSQKPNDFLLVAPVDSKAYWHHGSSRPRLKLGVPLPLSLPDLANLLTGQEKDVFGTSYLRLEKAEQGLAFVLDDPLPGLLVLDAAGHIRCFDQRPLNHGQGWKIDFVRDAAQALVKLDLTNHKGERLLLLVKNREQPEAFSEAQLNLEVPPGYPLLPLAQYAEH
ncbi:MAG: hypothetical protein K6G15_06565 [Desulfovibrio sp.]|nr:hypothetical protein [Desulfovibrio sp.]